MLGRDIKIGGEHLIGKRSIAEPLMMDSFLSQMHIWAVAKDSIHLANSPDLSTKELKVCRSILSRVTGTLHVSAMIKAGALR